MSWWDLSHCLKWMKTALFLRGKEKQLLPWAFAFLWRRATRHSPHVQLMWLNQSFQEVEVCTTSYIGLGPLNRPSTSQTTLPFQEILNFPSAISQLGRLVLVCGKPRESKMPLNILFCKKNQRRCVCVGGVSLQSRSFLPAHNSLKTCGKFCVFRRSQVRWTITL